MSARYRSVYNARVYNPSYNNATLRSRIKSSFCAQRIDPLVCMYVSMYVYVNLSFTNTRHFCARLNHSNEPSARSVGLIRCHVADS
jgi:hypothetical protein